MGWPVHLISVGEEGGRGRDRAKSKAMIDGEMIRMMMMMMMMTEMGQGIGKKQSMIK